MSTSPALSFMSGFVPAELTPRVNVGALSGGALPHVGLAAFFQAQVLLY